jgi:hypothetical protein
MRFSGFFFSPPATLPPQRLPALHFRLALGVAAVFLVPPARQKPLLSPFVQASSLLGAALAAATLFLCIMFSAHGGSNSIGSAREGVIGLLGHLFYRSKAFLYPSIRRRIEVDDEED